MNDMRVRISREQFESLSGGELGWALIQPAISQVRGQSLQQKKEVYDRLTPGQRSLFGFWVMHGHTQAGWLQFFLDGPAAGGYAAYLPMIRHGLEHVGARAMVANLDEAERVHRQNEELVTSLRVGAQASDVASPDSSHAIAEMRRQFEPVDRSLPSLLDETTAILEAYIRAAPDEFVVFTAGSTEP
jgi:hypothetical protein